MKINRMTKIISVNLIIFVMTLNSFAGYPKWINKNLYFTAKQTKMILKGSSTANNPTYNYHFRVRKNQTVRVKITSPSNNAKFGVWDEAGVSFVGKSDENLTIISEMLYVTSFSKTFDYTEDDFSITTEIPKGAATFTLEIEVK